MFDQINTVKTNIAGDSPWVMKTDPSSLLIVVVRLLSTLSFQDFFVKFMYTRVAVQQEQL